MWLAGLGAALVGPYLVFDGNLPALLQSSRNQAFGRSSSTDDWLTPSEESAGEPADQQPLAPTVSLAEALRYEVTPQWVISRWPRVATVVGELEWSGMRVPLITGGQPFDLVGSLTYYFDGRQQLRRISLEGYCGDEQAIVAIAIHNFGLQPEPAVGGGLYAFRWSREPVSVLSVRYAPVMNADAPHRRQVMLELNRPEAGWRLSPHMQALLQ
jgi:uncharacterized protein DUF6690